MISLSALTFSLIVSFCPVGTPAHSVNDPQVCKRVAWDVGLTATECSRMQFEEIAEFQSRGLTELKGASCQPEHGGLEQEE